MTARCARIVSNELMRFLADCFVLILMPMPCTLGNEIHHLSTNARYSEARADVLEFAETVKRSQFDLVPNAGSSVVGAIDNHSNTTFRGGQVECSLSLGTKQICAVQ